MKYNKKSRKLYSSNPDYSFFIHLKRKQYAETERFLLSTKE